MYAFGNILLDSGVFILATEKYRVAQNGVGENPC